MGLLQANTEAAKRVENTQAVCMKVLNSGGANHVDSKECEAILTGILDETMDHKADKMNRCVNMYDVRLRDDESCGMNWPPDLANVTPYLHREDVVKALNINAEKRTGWSECSGAVSAVFRARNSIPSIELLPDLLAEVPVLLFSGDQDMICNHLGTESLIKSLEFNGGKGFELSPGVWAPKRDWTFEGEPAGTYQEARNLTYVVFYNASHMVPFDYPRRTRDMLDRFMDVDISAIGGEPAESRIDGEKLPPTSVGAHPNSTKAEQEEDKKLKDAERKAYFHSGEAALVVIAVAAGVWIWLVWRDRRRRARLGYNGVPGDEGRESLIGGMGLEGFRPRRDRRADLEAADFDERELDDLDASTPGNPTTNGHDPLGHEKERRLQSQSDSRYSLGEASSENESGSEQTATASRREKSR